MGGIVPLHDLNEATFVRRKGKLCKFRLDFLDLYLASSLFIALDVAHGLLAALEGHARLRHLPHAVIVNLLQIIDLVGAITVEVLEVVGLLI